MEENIEKKNIVRFYRRGDEKEIVNLLKLIFPPYKDRDIDFWNWMYNENPIGDNFIVVGLINNKIIGVDHNVHLRVKIGNRTVSAFYGAASAVHPEFRGMRVFSQLSEFKKASRYQDIRKFSYMSSVNPIIIKRALKGRTLPFPYAVVYFRKIFDIDKYLKNNNINYAFLKKYYYYFLKILIKIKTNFSLTKKVKSDYVINEIKHFDDKINIFWDEIKNHYIFILERKKLYLNWRYCDQRGGKYIVKQLSDNGKILGYCVLNIKKDAKKDYSTGKIIDLITLPNRIDVANALIFDAMDFFSKNNVNNVSCLFVKNHPYKRILEKYGLINIGKFNLFYSSYEIEEQINILNNSSAKKVYFSYGDLL